MAKIKYSALVSDMRNSLNGSTMSKNRYGSYVRNKISPVNPQTMKQQNARAIFGNLSKAWRSLTEAQRKSWIEGSANFPFNDIFGDQKHLSGQALFIKINGNLEKIGKPRIMTAPAPGAMPDYSPGHSIQSIAGGGAEGDVLFDTNGIDVPTLPPTGFTMVVYVTPPVPAGINFVKNRYRFQTGTPSQNMDGDVAITFDGDTYEDQFGEPVTGEKVFVRYALINNTTGEQSVARELVFIK